MIHTPMTADLPYRTYLITYTNTGAKGFHFTIRDSQGYVVHEFDSPHFAPTFGLDVCRAWIDQQTPPTEGDSEPDSEAEA